MTQQAIYNAQRKTEEQAVKELTELYERAKRDLDNMVRSEIARDTEDSLRRASRFESLMAQIDEEVARIQSVTASTIVTGQRTTYQSTYERLAYEYEKAVNLEFVTGDFTERLNFAPLNRDAIQEALFNPQVAGRTISPTQFNDIMTAQRLALQSDIRAMVANIIATGQDLKELADQLETIFLALGDTVDKAKNRALMTARTELLKAYSYAQYDADMQAVESGIKISRIWQTARDERVRSSHRAMDGQKAQFRADGSSFFIYPNGIQTPAPRIAGMAGDVINCRCYVVTSPEGFEPTEKAYRDTDGTWNQNPTNVEFAKWVTEWRKQTL